MSVRHSLLAILDQGSCYGYQLRQEFNRRTGDAWPLNVGQVYTTLDRLERDGLVVQQGEDAEGHVMYAITHKGTVAANEWLTTSVVRADRDELAMKIALASTLPGVNTAEIIRNQQSKSGPIGATSPVIAAWHEAIAEAESRWLDVVSAMESTPFGLSDDVPKRGRPARL
jgi:DNA-binding PadR family transcriptional regulator